MNIFKLLTTVGFFTLLSRFTGFIRTVCLSAFLGASVASDALVMAIRIANFLRKVLAEGAFNACFVPIFSKVLNIEGKDNARDLASKIYSLLLMITIFISVIVVFFYPIVLKLFAPGFNGDRMSLSVLYGRICFPFIISTTTVAVFSGILNTLGKFGIPAFLQVFVNLGSIFAMILAYYYDLDQGIVVSIGFLVTGVLQVAIIKSYATRNNFVVDFRFNFLSPKIALIFKNMIPGLISSGIWQINLLIDSRFASTLTSGGVSYIFYADQILQLPLATLGIAIGSALVPVFSRSINLKKFKQLRIDFNKSLAFSFGMAFPATVGLVVLSFPIVAFIIGRGKVTLEDVKIVSDLLSVFAFALPAYVLNKILIAACFSDSDTKTPLYSTTLNMIVNVTLLFFFVPRFSYIGIALSNTVAAYISVLYLYIKKPHKFKILKLFKKILLKQIIVSGILAGLLMLTSDYIFEGFYDYGFLYKLLILGVVILIAIGIYCTLGVVFGFFNQSKIRMEFKK